MGVICALATKTVCIQYMKVIKSNLTPKELKISPIIKLISMVVGLSYVASIYIRKNAGW